ncbi:sugar-binding transcriptional regulator [Amnibacterium flavum]|nr:sugar-binding domain-containing protein [Amnibacterium flavum]
MSTPEAGGTEGRALLAAVARAYYIDDLSRVEIADMFGVSRFKVSRLLARARDEGVVTIEINDGGLPDAVLGERLREALGLASCEVVRSHGDGDSMRSQVGAAAAASLSGTLSPDEVVGVSWGRTLNATTSALRYLPPLTIVQLTGFVAGDLASSPIEVARRVSDRSGGNVFPIFAPLFVQDVGTAQSLRDHPDIRAALDLFPRVTTALLSVGAWEPSDTQVREVLSKDDLDVAVRGGCVADIAGILVKADGTPVESDLESRSIGITYEQLRAVPRVVAVAGGPAKAAAIIAVARAGLITELVADHSLAGAVLAALDA